MASTPYNTAYKTLEEYLEANGMRTRIETIDALWRIASTKPCVPIEPADGPAYYHSSMPGKRLTLDEFAGLNGFGFKR